MRILFISNFYPPYEIGGYEQWCQEVANRLIDRGHQVEILTSRFGIGSKSEIYSQRITRSLYLQTDISYYRPIDFFLRRSYQEKSNLRELRLKIDQYKPDIVMIWGMWNLSYWIPYWVERWMPNKAAYFISNYWPIDPDPHKEYWQLPTKKPVLEVVKKPLRDLVLKKLEKENYPPRLRFDHAVCCSEFVRDTLVKKGRLPLKSGVLLGGIDPEPFEKISKMKADQSNGSKCPLNLLYFGRLIYDKGVHTAIEAVGLLKEKGLSKDIRLTILGSGHPEYEARLRQMVSQFGLDSWIEFVQKVSRDDVPKWLGRSDVFLFTSIWPEPMARSVMEAMAAGLLVIGTEVGGQSEMLLHNQNALTFEAEDANGLADHISRISQDNELRRRLASAGQKMVLHRFTLSRMVEDIERYLENIVKINSSC